MPTKWIKKSALPVYGRVKTGYLKFNYMKKWLLGIAAFLTVLAGGTQIDNLGGGGRTNEKERFVFNAVEVSTTSFPMFENHFQHKAVT